MLSILALYDERFIVTMLVNGWYDTKHFLGKYIVLLLRFVILESKLLMEK